MSAPWPRTSWGRAAGVAGPHLIGSCLVVAATVSLVGSWRPTGDVAAIALRSGDTFGRHVPLVGMPSTAGEGLHHPGPLQLWVNGAFDAVVGGRVGVLVATAVVNVVAIAVVVSVGRRLGGGPGALVAAIACLLVGWSLYGLLLVSPLNPHAALFPLGAALVSGVATAVRPTRWTLAAALLFGSYAAQAHLVFAVLVLVTSAPLVVVAWRNTNRDERPPLVRLATALGLLAWAGPILDVVLHRGGNLRVAVDVATADNAETTLGIGRAVSVLAGAVAPSPIFLERDQTGTELFIGASGPATVAVIAALGLLAAESLRRRSSQPLVAVTAMTTVVLAVVTVVAIGRFPSLALNAFALHNYLPLWIVSIAVWGVGGGLAVDALLRLRGPLRRCANRRVRYAGCRRTLASSAGPLPLSAHLLRPSPAIAAAAVATAVAVGSVVLLPRPTASAEMTYVEALAAQVDASLPQGTHLLAVHDDLRLFGVDAGLVRELRDAGHDIVVPRPVGQSFGEHRVGGEPSTTLRLSVGPAPVGNPDVVAEYRPDPEIVRERDAAVAELVEAVTADPTLLEGFAGSVSDRRTTERFVRDDLAGLVAGGLLEGRLLDDEATRTLVRITAQPWQSLYVEQLPGAAPAS